MSEIILGEGGSLNELSRLATQFDQDISPGQKAELRLYILEGTPEWVTSPIIASIQWALEQQDAPLTKPVRREDNTIKITWRKSPQSTSQGIRFEAFSTLALICYAIIAIAAIFAIVFLWKLVVFTEEVVPDWAKPLLGLGIVVLIGAIALGKVKSELGLKRR